MPTRPPKFLGPPTLNLTAVVGATVVLPCRVTHLDPASLSWVRLSGPSPAASHLTVLSSGTILFSSSPRLALLHHEGSPDWTLQITGVILRDGGMYECQVSSEPRPDQQTLPGEHRAKDVSGGEPGSCRGHWNSWSWTCPGPEGCLQCVVTFDLILFDFQGEQLSSERRRQKTSILAPRELAPQPGDTITLECVVTEHQTQPPYFTW